MRGTMTMAGGAGSHEGARRGELRGSFTEGRIRTRWLRCFAALLLVLVPVHASAVDMEGPLGGSPRRGAVPESDFRLDRIRFENDGEWLRMTIPIKAPWAHWTLTDPPRIIVDLGQTTSLLSKAPGLYQARLDRGPVRTVRTSQFLYSPLDHRVRITLDLSEVVAYQARRVGDEIQILIPDRGVRTPRAVVIGPAGIAGIDDPVRPPESVPAPAGEAPAGAMVTTSMPLILPGAPRPDAVPPEIAKEEIAPTDRALAPGGVSKDAARPVARTLREALDEFGGIAVEPVAEDVSEPAVALRGGGTSPGSSGLAPRRGDDGLVSPASAPAKAASRTARTVPARASTTLMPASTGGLGAETPSAHPASPREAPPAKETADEEGASASAPPVTPRSHAAARLLRQAVLATLRGDLKAAGVAAERAHRFYAGTASGDQCGLLARELLLLQGRPADAGRLAGLPTLPDTTMLPRALYLSFVDQYRRSGDMASVDRVLSRWGPAYSPLPGLGALRYAMGEAFLRAGDAAAAEEHLRKVPPGDSLHAPALLLIALVQDRRGERESALETYRQVTALGPGPYQARGLARTADIEFQLGRVREALASYERLLQSSPPRDEEVWAVYQAGNCRLLLGESELAKERYETVARLWPQSFWAPFAKERLEEMTWRAQWTGGNASR